MDSVAPLPTGGGVTVIAEHRGRRDQDGQPAGGKRGDGGEPRPETASLAPPGNHDSPPPIAEEELVPAETLFTATLLANEMAPAPNTAEALRRHAGPAWTPPDSSLRLKDKLI
jgi:hypothetical protein